LRKLHRNRHTMSGSTFMAISNIVLSLSGGDKDGYHKKT